MKRLDQIRETSYLNAINAPQYRRIMRIFFAEYEKMRFQLYKEDVFDLLRIYPEFEDYTMEQLKSDLNALVEWKNLTPIQDPKRVYTIADYKNKQFRYSMSEYAVEIERLTVKLENLFIEGGSLSQSYFVRIEEAVSLAKSIGEASPKQLNEWWHNLQEDFKRTTYIRYNCYMLGKKALAYLDEKKKVDGVRGRLDAKEEERLEKQKEIEGRQEETDSLVEILNVLDVERLALNMEELEASIDRLDSFKESKAEAETEAAQLSGRIEEHREKIRSFDVQMRDCQNSMEVHVQEADKYQEELEENNQIILFEGHDTIKKLPEYKERRAIYQLMGKDLKELEQKIREGGKALSDLDQITREWDKEEQKLQEWLIKMQQAREQLKEAESLEHECRDKLIEGYHIHAESNKELAMSKENLSMIIAQIYRYGGARDLGEIQRLLHQMWEQQNQDLMKHYVQYQNSQEEACQREQKLKQELEEVIRMQDPVPERKKRVEEARKRLSDKNILYLPFYQAVEFAEGVEQEEKSLIECQLSDAGLLDALVVSKRDYEKSKEILQGLSDTLIYVAPTVKKTYPFLEPGDVETELKETVLGILSNISDAYDKEGEFILARDGYFRNGILEGYSAAEEEASFIGVNARKEKKERLIAQKREELIEAEKRLVYLMEMVERIRKRQVILRQEYDSLPRFDDLDQAIELVRSNSDDLERNKNFYEKQEQLTEQLKKRKKACEQKVITACKPLPYRRELEAYQEVIEALGEYDKLLNSLMHTLSALELDEEKRKRVQDAIEKEEESIDLAYVYLGKARRKEKELEVQIRHIEEYLDNPEIKAKTERLRQIREEMQEKNLCLQQNKERLAVLRNYLEILKGEIEGLKKDAVEQIEREIILRKYFQEELALGLVARQEDNTLYEAAKKVKDCIKEGDKNRSGVEMTTALMKTFQAHIGTLLNYGTSMEECFSDEGIDVSVLRSRQQIVFIWNGKRLYLEEFYTVIRDSIESNELLIKQKDREMFEGVLADTLSRKLSNRIGESRGWIRDMSSLMGSMDTSMALTFSLEWRPKSAEGEMELDTKELEKILSRDRELLTTEDIEKVSVHFRTKIRTAKLCAEENGDIVNYVDLIREALDYRKWFEFRLHYYRNGENRKELTNGAFNRFSGGEKAMAMYVPLFAAVNAQYKKSENPDHPRMIAMDEAFAGVDDKNISSMFELVEKLDFDYIMNSQVLWGCYETVRTLRIAELLRPANAKLVTVIYYYWNGRKRVLDEQ